MAQRPGVPNIFRPDMARNMSRIFPPEKGGFELPNVVSGTVQLTHDFLGTIANAAVSIFDVNGAADVVTLTTAVAVPEGFLWIIDEIGLFTDDAVSRAMTLWVHYINSAGDFAVPVYNQDSGATASKWWAVSKRIVVPPQGKVELSVPALTAGKKLRLTIAYLQMPLGQFSPRT